MAEQPGVPSLEPINEPLYDTQVYPVAGAATLTFFTQGLSGTVVAGVPRTLRETNVPIAGALPNPQQFHVYGIQVVPDAQCQSAQTTAGAATAVPVLTDQVTIISQSFFRLYIGTKSYVEVTSILIPCGHGLTGAAATTIGAREVSSFHNGVAHQNNYFDVTVRVGHSRKPIHIPPQQNFRCELVFPGPAATAVTLNNTLGGTATGGMLIKVVLRGIRWREVQ